MSSQSVLRFLLTGSWSKISCAVSSIWAADEALIVVVDVVAEVDSSVLVTVVVTIVMLPSVVVYVCVFSGPVVVTVTVEVDVMEVVIGIVRVVVA